MVEHHPDFPHAGTRAAICRFGAQGLCATVCAIACILAALNAVPPAASAQTRATAADIRGSVRDESEAVVPGVAVMVANPAAGIVRTAMTGADGRFSVPALPVGMYAVRAELVRVRVQVLKTRRPHGGISRGRIDHAASLSRHRTGSPSWRPSPRRSTPRRPRSPRVVSQQQIDNLPINGRNFISFAVITPGVNFDRSRNQGAAATSGLVFAGQRPRSNNITVDGLDNNDATVGSVRATFSQEAIREFQVLTNSYSAEFGKAAGGVLNIVTRSGTNTFDGNAFLYFRDKSLNARGYFEQLRLLPATPIELREGAVRPEAVRRHVRWSAQEGPQLLLPVVRAARRRQPRTLVTIDDTTLVADPPADRRSARRRRSCGRPAFPIETGHVPVRDRKAPSSWQSSITA